MRQQPPPPDAGLALVRVPVAPVQAEPRVAAPQTSQVPYGRPVWTLEEAGDWHRVYTVPDAYEGWMHAGYLALVDVSPDVRDALRLAAAPPPGESHGLCMRGDPAVRMSLGCIARVGGRTLRLPLGAWLAPDATLLDGEAPLLGELPARFSPDGAAAFATAARYFSSTSYQWGGVTPWGADCSGMVQSAYALHGVDLPRDAWQQALVGDDAGPDLRAHHPGDLLFFSDRDDRRVTHVGLAAGDGVLCHVALGRGGWATDALAEPEDAYAERLATQLVAARRVIR